MNAKTAATFFERLALFGRWKNGNRTFYLLDWQTGSETKELKTNISTPLLPGADTED
ncbi:MAG: hypothetical protein Q7U38_20200 [Methylobacter sp.]|nr:hypothetical protein [Methylobacter sp.]MDP2096997.1 hypothetical protein [Methylobacter sp.]MDP2428910.1 hypothetical protein [Methylobacter sp.]MDP3056325.1 hypothetical protein [Methylobacter sp.]MDP3361108.1 hypothetical protein [Methylobacter sp.]